MKRYLLFFLLVLTSLSAKDSLAEYSQDEFLYKTFFKGQDEGFFC